MSFEDINKLIKQFEEGPNIIPSGSYSLSKKDIKQDEQISTTKEKVQTNRPIKSQEKLVDDIFYNNFADFTEKEDENGNIILLWYSKAEYEYRGNFYCRYILCNEKTCYREDGIAQIKNGQYIHIEDSTRATTIKNYMESSVPILVKKYGKDIEEPEKDFYKIYDEDTNITLRYIGWRELADDIEVLYQEEEKENSFYVRYLCKNHGDIEHKNYAHADEDYVKSLLANKKFKQFSFVNIEPPKQWIDDKTPKFLKITFILISVILLLYPISEAILWFLAHIAPHFDSKITTAQITEFAMKSLPYAYHPNFGWLKHFSINILNLVVFGYCLIQICDDSYSDNGENHVQNSPLPFGILTTILAAVFIYAMYTPTFFDKISTIAAWIVVPTILLGLFCR